MTEIQTEKFIDVDKILAGKSPKLAKNLPKFIISYLKRIIHQEQLNSFMYRNREKIGSSFLEAILEEFGVNVVVKGAENIPICGQQLISSNHPLGGLDGIALIREVGKYRNPIKFPVNDLLMNVTNLQEFFIPINKHGSNAENRVIFDQAFESENIMLYFPAGLVSRKQKGVIKDLEWKKTFITMARKHKRDVIPTFIDGKNSMFFYRLANIRKNLSIKENFEMLYLVDEMYKQNNKTINIIFGKPIPYTVFDNSKKDLEWAQLVKNHVYKLEKDRNADFVIN
ncbi:MAG: glycerol acyltransferase [Bacteroidota bacterium]